MRLNKGTAQSTRRPAGQSRAERDTGTRFPQARHGRWARAQQNAAIMPTRTMTARPFPTGSRPKRARNPSEGPPVMRMPGVGVGAGCMVVGAAAGMRVGASKVAGAVGGGDDVTAAGAAVGCAASVCAMASAKPGMSGQSTPPAARYVSINPGNCWGMSSDPINTTSATTRNGTPRFSGGMLNLSPAASKSAPPPGSADVDANDLQPVAVLLEQGWQVLSDDLVAVAATG